MTRHQPTYTTMATAIGKAFENINSFGELQALTDMLSARWKQVEAEHLRDFKIGDQVGFDAGKKGWLQGYIVSLAGTGAKVKVRGYESPWTVSASYLNKLAGPKED